MHLCLRCGKPRKESMGHGEKHQTVKGLCVCTREEIEADKKALAERMRAAERERMHTFKWGEYRFHYNSDFSGDIIVHGPSGMFKRYRNGSQEVEIPAQALVEFLGGRLADKLRDYLEAIKEGFDSDDIEKRLRKIEARAYK